MRECFENVIFYPFFIAENVIYCILRKVGNADKFDSYWISSGFTALLFFNPQGAVIFQDDGVALVHSHEPAASVNRQHREPHAEIRRQFIFGNYE